MTFIKIDPTALRLALTKVSSFATSYEQSASSIRSKNLVEGYPADLSSLATADTSVGELKTTVSEIKTRLNTAIEINSKGITFSGVPAGSFYIVPDGQADTTENVKAAMTSITDALADAATIQTALDKGDMASVAQTISDKVTLRQNDDIYAALLTDQLGPRNVVKIAGVIMYPEGLDTNWDDPNKDSEHQKAKTTLLTWNTMFAAATNSSLWTLEHRKSYASELASLITTGSFADNSPLNDAVWIPRGFNLLLTGNNRDVGAPSLNPVQDSMSPLAINADFLTTLAHSVKLWEGMISNSLDKYGWRSCLHLNQSMTNLNTTITEGDLDPVTGILTAMGRQPKAALDFLASPDHATGGGTIDDSNWKWVLGRQKDYVALEGLTASLAGASNLRTSDTFTSRRAAWITEQGVIYLSGVKDSYFWNPTSKHNTAIMLANSVCDIWDIANDTKYEDCKPKPVFEQLLPKAWDGAHNNEVISLLQCILTDDTALRTLSNAAGNFTAHHLSTATLEVDRGTSTDAITDSTLLKKAYDQLLGNANMDAKLFGLIYGASAKGRNVETNEENELNQILVDTLFYSLAFAPTPGKPWIAAAASVAQDIAKGYAQDIVESAHKDAKTRNDSRELAGQRLNWSVLFAMSAAHMLPDNAYVGVSSEWAYKDEDGHWHINVEKASKDYVAFNNWVQHNTELLALMSSTGASINDAFANGFSKGSQ